MREGGYGGEGGGGEGHEGAEFVEEASVDGGGGVDVVEADGELDRGSLVEVVWEGRVEDVQF